jgi:hypothetical protein
MQLALAFALVSCAQDVQTVYENLNTPLGLTIETSGGGHLVSFYGYNRSKQDFAGYAVFQASTISQSRDLYDLEDALFLLALEDHADLSDHDVSDPIQIKMGGSAPTGDIYYSSTALTPGHYITVRAYPEYPENLLNNRDENAGPTASDPSNTIQVP